MTFEFSPVVCRLLARSHGKALAAWEISFAGRLPLRTVKRLSKLTSWDNVTVGDARKFMLGCGINKSTVRRHREFIRRRKWHHLKSPYHRKLLLLVANGQKH